MSAVPSAAHLAPIATDETRHLYEQYGDRIFAFCLSRLRQREEAEDAVQTTFLYALRGLRHGVEPRFPLAWLFKIAENVCHSRHRADSRRNRHEASRDPDLVATLAAPARATDELIDLPEALGAIPERQRRALLLREWQGLSYQEIGAELGLSQSAVETLLFRARRSLASRLRALDLSAALAFLRSLLQGGAGKVAAAAAVATVGAAVAVLPAVDPGKPAPAGSAPGRTVVPVGSAPAATESATPDVGGNAVIGSAAARAGGPASQSPARWQPQTSGPETTAGTPPGTAPGAAPAASPPGTAPAPAPTSPTSTASPIPKPPAPTTSVGAGATTPTASAGATVSTGDGSATASAGAGAETPAGPVEGSAAAGASTSGATGSVDASVGSQSVGAGATVPAPTVPAPKLP